MGMMSELCRDFWHNFHDLKNNVESHTGILTGVGIFTSLVGTVLACRATVKIVNQAEEHKQLVDGTKTACAEAGMDEKATKKEVMKTYRHIGVDYVRKYWPAVGLMAVGYAIIIRSHNILVAKNEALMAAYVSLEQLFNKYRGRVAEKIGTEEEAAIYKQAQIDQAEENIIGQYAGEYRDGSYLLYNESCAEYSEGCPQANDFMATTIEKELNNKFDMFIPVYLNDVMRAAGHEEINGGWNWVKAKGLTDGIDFKLHDPDFNPAFANGCITRRGEEEPIIKMYLNGFVHVSKLYSSEYRQYLKKNKADGGIMGGELGRNEVIIG